MLAASWSKLCTQCNLKLNVSVNVNSKYLKLIIIVYYVINEFFLIHRKTELKKVLSQISDLVNHEKLETQ